MKTKMEKETLNLLRKDFGNCNISIPSHIIPTYVGGYRFGNRSTNYVQLNLPYKPHWLHRTFMRICLGMYWYDDLIHQKNKLLK
jgi:hypothetical protein